jgi:5-methyltetrahydropteroyltriglutamate--homocysteine methyltransferase
MKRSTERILTTHVGSLPRPADLRAMWAKKDRTAEDEAALQIRLRSAVGEVVRMQKDVGIDIANDGEFGKPMRASTDRGAWGNYIFDRLSGFTATSAETIAPDAAKPGASMRIVGMRWEQREFAEFYADTGLGAPSTPALRPTCTGPITYTAQQFLRDQLVNFEARRECRRHRRGLRQRHRPR